MRKRLACVAALSIGAMALLTEADATASSHREAPFITKMPKVDGTDFYLFRSYETGHTGTATNPNVVIIANYQPLQDAYGGPNYFSMDPQALYEIHIDNTGDGAEDITFSFSFNNALNADLAGQTVAGVSAAAGKGILLDIADWDCSGAACVKAATKQTVSIPFIAGNVGDPPPALSATNENAFRNVRETYKMNVIRGNRRTGTSTPVTHAAGPSSFPADPATFVKPVDFIGTKSFGGVTGTVGAGRPFDNATALTNYQAYARAHIYNVDIPGCTGNDAHARVFVGQRQEQFAVLIGNVFDLVNADANELTAVHLPGNANNPIRDKNVTSIALEIPANCLQPSATEAVIGGWTTASIKQARVINPDATYDKPSKEGGAWVQVSRLGVPLVNEVGIGIQDKDKFNGSEPKNDVANFATYITHPTLPTVLELLFGSANVAAPRNVTNSAATSRADLQAALLLGLCVDPPACTVRINRFGGAPASAEMTRLNVKTDFSAVNAALAALPPPPSGQQRLGAALCYKPGADDNSPKVIDPTLPNCDVHGFPNGRRPGDDVVDIELRVFMGYLVGSGVGTSKIAPVADLPLGDAIDQQAPAYDPNGDGAGAFPFLADPNPGAISF